MYKYLTNSQSFPLTTPSPLATTSLFSVCESVSVCRQVHFCHILDSTYKPYHIVSVYLFLTYCTQYHNLQLNPCCCEWYYFILFMAEQYSIVYMCYIFIHSHVDGYSGCFLSNCEQCCYEPKCAYIFLNYSFIWIYAQEWDCWIIWQFYVQFSKEPPLCFSQWWYQFTFLLTVQEGSLS